MVVLKKIDINANPQRKINFFSLHLTTQAKGSKYTGYTWASVKGALVLSHEHGVTGDGALHVTVSFAVTSRSLLSELRVGLLVQHD